jgi:predicted phosphodiesterase
MKIAIISDIHGNMEALTQVLQDIDACNIKNIFCLGDMVGYGPNPEEVVQTIRTLKIPTILGNHELALKHPIHMEWFNPPAQESLKKTFKLLSNESIQFIKGLPRAHTIQHYRFVHGFPPDDVSKYLFAASDKEIVQVFEKINETCCFVGHTHLIEIVHLNGHDVNREPIAQGITPINKNGVYIINVGSVGQPRDENSKAKYVLYDFERHAVELRCVSYDVKRTAEKIIAAGFPKSHADRLYPS